jgi:hypothetical protein
MAVVSISRIQIRRGKKNSGTGLPQLASGEFGWAIDTQELFIGNGAVSEGAPFVGNTKILSENDNLFDFANNYTYKITDGVVQTGDAVNNPVERSLQDRLDDRVSVRAFGANGDGSDQTVQLQRAIDQLFLNPANLNAKSRVRLHIEPGNYTVSSTIYIPPHATIVGAGIEKTVFNFTGTGAVFQTVNGNSTVGAPASDSTSTLNNQAREIYLSGFTINSAGNAKHLLIQSCRDSVFEDIKISGSRSLGSAITTDDIAVQLNSLSSIVTCKNNVFKRLRIQNTSYAVYSDFDITQNTWENCDFDTLAYGFVFGGSAVIGVSGQLTGPFNNLISSSRFNDIEKQALWIAKGTGNQSDTNRYYRTGNDGGTSANATTPVIEFQDFENISNNDWFERTEDLGYGQAFINVPYIPEVKGPSIYKNNYTNKINISSSPSEYTRIINFPADTEKSIEIDYIYRSNQVNAVRQGVIKIIVDPDNDTSLLSDDYEFIGTGDAEAIDFRAQNYDFGGNGIDTVALMMLNSTIQDNGVMYFNVKTKN